MTKIRHPSNEVIKLRIMGPKSMTPRTMCVETRLSNTWLQLLNNEMGLNVSLDDGIFLCTSTYTPTAPNNGKGWRAELTERISAYAEKFKQRRKQFTVRLCYHHHINLSANGTSPSKRYRASTSGPTVGVSVPRSVHQGRRPNIVIATRGSATSNGLVDPQRYRDDNILKPRYHTANGLPPKTPQRAQQLLYGTRLKRLHDQTVVVGKPRDTLSARRESPPNVANCSKRNYVPNNGFESTPVFAMKVEIPSVVDDSQIFQDGSQSENRNEMNGSSGEEEEETEDDKQQIHSRVNGGLSLRGAGNNFRPMNSDDLSDEDGASEFTTATQEEMELIQSGIRVEDIKSLAERRFSGFSNAYMLRVRNEIKKLKAKKIWMRNLKRSPLAYVLLDQIFNTEDD